MRLFTYIAVVIISALVITGGMSLLLRKGLKRSSVDFFGKMNAAGDEKERTEIFLIGSSRILVQADPQIVDSVTGLHSYNYGLNALTIKSSYNIFRYALLKHPEAKLAVFNIDYNMFAPLKDPYKDPFYYAYETAVPSLLMSDSGVKNQVHRMGIFDVCLYDDMVKYAAISGLINPNKRVAGMYKGYAPQTEKNSFTVPDPSDLAGRAVPFSEQGISVLKDIADICNKHHIAAAFVIAPYPEKYSPRNYISNYDMIMQRVRAVATEKNIRVLDYTQMPLTKDTSFFYNVNHLNTKGAKIFSTALAQDLKNILANSAAKQQQ